MSANDRFHALHRQGDPLLLPNAWDYASAVALAAAGFAAIGTTSLGVAAARGVPDATGGAREATRDLARLLAPLPAPVTVDIEYGFSEDPGAVGALAAELSDLGIAGVNLEDGRPGGTLAEPARHARLVWAAKRQAPRLFVNARVDTYWLPGSGQASPGATLRRARRYLEVGADGVFVPGHMAEHDIAALVTALRAPLNVLFLPGVHPVSRLAALGVARISTGSLLYRTALHSAVAAAADLRGPDGPAAPPLDYTDIQRLVGEGSAEPG